MLKKSGNVQIGVSNFKKYVIIDKSISHPTNENGYVAKNGTNHSAELPMRLHHSVCLLARDFRTLTG
jgi:hypothetical protein